MPEHKYSWAGLTSWASVRILNGYQPGGRGVAEEEGATAALEMALVWIEQTQ